MLKQSLRFVETKINYIPFSTYTFSLMFLQSSCIKCELLVLLINNKHYLWSSKDMHGRNWERCNDLCFNGVRNTAIFIFSSKLCYTELCSSDSNLSFFNICRMWDINSVLFRNVYFFSYVSWIIVKIFLVLLINIKQY